MRIFLSLFLTGEILGYENFQVGDEHIPLTLGLVQKYATNLLFVIIVFRNLEKETCGGGSRNRRDTSDYGEEYYESSINEEYAYGYGDYNDTYTGYTAGVGGKRIQPRIHHGFGAEKEAWPWIVHLQFRYSI